MAKEVTLNGKAVAFAFFTRDEAQTVEALTQRIFPDDDLGPGAPPSRRTCLYRPRT